MVKVSFSIKLAVFQSSGCAYMILAMAGAVNRLNPEPDLFS